MSNKSTYAINDIRLCVQQAHQLANHIQRGDNKERALYRAFTSLAGDKRIGLVAFILWRGRSHLLSMEVDRARASRARSF